ncbi:S1 RNA-binding domain-containing protein [Oscillatoria salina]|uniref:S1 RNA-binding domain-containing protein n=1 Tax=Oscillatoria salina TaxID=331517 RepID=UPI0013BE8464|nr:S1 RNA-binding domain-containing protein [Oscillatoria salina]MBZ8181187.1 S1 RNA-binding domain-containing protein [Oscillatoria salina IIICB1]NET91539.1 S1 RNA-binding domain-containing protein [Kamptonema sp. SIO1D9]
MSNTQSWSEIKKYLKVGTKLTGVVTKHWPFGVFVLLPGIEFIGLVQITDFKDEGVMKPSEYPAVGASIDAVVLGFKETGQQIWLGMKPSQLNQSRNLEK